MVGRRQRIEQRACAESRFGGSVSSSEVAAMRWLFTAVVAILLVASAPAQDLRRDGKVVGRVEADGDVRLGGKVVGRFEKDGDVRVDGKVLARIEKDGDIRIGGKVAGRVEADGDVRVGGKVVGRVEKDGDVRQDGKVIGTAKGVPRERAAVLFFFGVFDLP
jgi:hypothetical protein